jgi:hypothetical protein
LMMSAFRYFSGAFRCGFVSMRGFIRSNYTPEPGKRGHSPFSVTPHPLALAPPRRSRNDCGDQPPGHSPFLDPSDGSLH